jgi:hypothetical protein
MNEILIGGGIEIGRGILIGGDLPPVQVNYIVIENTTDIIVTEQGGLIIEEIN